MNPYSIFIFCIVIFVMACIIYAAYEHDKSKYEHQVPDINEDEDWNELDY